MVAVCAVIIDSHGLSFGAVDRRAQGFVLFASSVPKKARKQELPGPELTAATAEKVFGWKNVHKHGAELIGKKQDKLGRWRSAKVPDYSDPAEAYAIDERMKQLGRWEHYLKELSKLTKEKKLPSDWATPEQRSRAAIKILAKSGSAAQR
jgi:hypothetical protein